jgi:hypothetical protein
VPRFEVRKDMPVRIVGVVHGDVHPMASFVRVFFKGKAVIFVEHGFAEFAAMRLGDFYFPGRHGIFGESVGVELTPVRTRTRSVNEG